MAKISFYDIASVLVEHNGLTQSKAGNFVKTMFDIIQERLPIDQQVKIKGLGTFKIVAVGDRESINVNTGERILIEGHSKIAFTPDTAMKELINKPFSQFETVILNDGVAFEGINAEDDSEQNVILDSIANPLDAVAEEAVSPADEVPVEYDDDTPAENEEEAINDDEEEEVSQEEEKDVLVVEENFVSSEENKISSVIDFVPPTEMTDNLDVDDEEETSKRSVWKSVLLHVLYVALIAALAAYGGYWYGINHHSNIGKERIVAEKAVKPKVENKVKPKADSIVKKVVPADTIKKDMVKKTAPATIDNDKYAAMDARVRTGAYAIVGEDYTVTVRKGETLSQLSRRVFGDGMQCYIEVFNGISSKDELKEGQKIKVPKLQLKKKVKAQ